MSSAAEPLVIHADSLIYDDNAGTLTAVPATSSPASEHPALKLDEVILIFRPSPSAHSVIVGLIENTDSKEAPFQFLAIQTPADVPVQLSSVLHVAQLPPHLARLGGGVVHYVLSTKAGTGKAVQFWEEVLNPLLKIAAQSLNQDTLPDRIVVTESDDSVREYARGKHEAAVPRTIVLLSGDGGMVDSLNSSEPPAASADTPLPTVVLIPLGTGNALFNSLHKALFTGPSGMVIALRTLFDGVATPLPAFKASFSTGSKTVKYANKDTSSGAETPSDPAAAVEQLYRQETDVAQLYGSIVASYGFHASIVYESDTPEYRAYGSARFSMVAQELLKESHEYVAEIDIRRSAHDEGTFERIPRDRHAYVLSTMVSNLERTFTISPASKPLDGRLRLIHFGPVGPERTLDAMMKAYDGGKHVGTKWDDNGAAVFYDDVEEVRVQIEDDDARWRKACIDGTIVDIPKGGTFSVQKEQRSLFNVVVDRRVL